MQNVKDTSIIHVLTEPQWLPHSLLPALPGGASAPAPKKTAPSNHSTESGS